MGSARLHTHTNALITATYSCSEASGCQHGWQGLWASIPETIQKGNKLEELVSACGWHCVKNPSALDPFPILGSRKAFPRGSKSGCWHMSVIAFFPLEPKDCSPSETHCTEISEPCFLAQLHMITLPPCISVYNKSCLLIRPYMVTPPLCSTLYK